MVSGDVSDNWSNLLIQRAEAFKQAAFFRSVNADAITSEHASRKALADYNGTIGVNAGDSAALPPAIRQAEATIRKEPWRERGCQTLEIAAVTVREKKKTPKNRHKEKHK